MTEIKPFNQVPSWDQDAKISISMNDFVQLQQFFSMFMAPAEILQETYIQAVNDGVIKFKYVEPDGTEISAEEAQDRYTQFTKQLETV